MIRGCRKAALGSFELLELQILNQGSCDLTVNDLFQALGGPLGRQKAVS